MGHTKNKAITFMNDALRDYVYGTRKRSKLMLVARIALLVAIATVVSDAYACYMVPVPTPVASSGTFLDGYMHRYWFDVGAIVFAFVLAAVRRLFRAVCRAYVRRLDMNDGIANGGEESMRVGDSNAKPADGASHIERRVGVNGDYVSAVDSHEGTISESEGGDA